MVPARSGGAGQPEGEARLAGDTGQAGHRGGGPSERRQLRPWRAVGPRAAASGGG